MSRSVTRWTSAYLVVKRLLDVKEHLKVVLLEHNMTMLQPVEWEELSHVETLLSKFAVYTNMAGGEQYTTLSLIIPYYIELRHHLEDMKEVEAVKAVSDILLSELERRFSKLLDVDDKDHDPIYMIATLLDPRYKMILDADQISHAKKECLKHLVNGDSDDDNDNNTRSSHRNPVSSSSTGDMQPPSKRFRYIHQIIEKKVTEKKEVALRHPKLPEIQLDAYIQRTDGQMFDEDTDPVL